MSGADDLPVAVVGGGLAGIAAAVRLVDLGRRVVLLEARPQLGGATYSFERDGLTVDTGQHVFLRCYHAYRALLDRLGVGDLAPVQDRFAIPVLHHRSHRPHLSWLRRARRGPAPLHLGPALARYAPLSPVERVRTAAGALALRSVDPDDPATDAVTFGSWLRGHGQTARAVDRLWGVITVAALNLHPDEASLALAARVFRTALLGDHTAADIGVPTVPLRQLHAEPAARLFAEAGVRVHTRTKVRSIDARDTGFVLRTPQGEVTAGAVVVAVPSQAAAALVPARAIPDARRFLALGSSPIVNVHVHFDRRVTALPFAAALDSPVQWVFDRTGAAGADRKAGSQYLVVSVSAASDCVGTPADELRAAYTAALAALFPRAREARVLDSFVTREPHATFRQGPGTAALRPSPTTHLPGLVLAGAWTATGWPDTMESAVRSGLLAANSLDPGSLDPGSLGRGSLDRGSRPGCDPGRMLSEATS